MPHVDRLADNNIDGLTQRSKRQPKCPPADWDGDAQMAHKREPRRVCDLRSLVQINASEDVSGHEWHPEAKGELDEAKSLLEVDSIVPVHRLHLLELSTGDHADGQALREHLLGDLATGIDAARPQTELAHDRQPEEHRRSEPAHLARGTTHHFQELSIKDHAVVRHAPVWMECEDELRRIKARGQMHALLVYTSEEGEKPEAA
mmetsp:Transcript_24006/g.61888  ORF Transcript_24006/g.61888 Transcript_24006/m.61888 type:complete len:204 (+) Transcript_24006:279-890(+)|eukprot:CAMPEP_0119425188 /NCGR_PEP_ID=MMETSP1335-20130426/34073_1 /TAXON_ID=259385 /ORGANISM="Chrysoculter rhomboideus, Strain RCC1486" /LENGTH=203 /DNA_ID=CAMNT_0007450743 /DNA_START=181 /DNA_END=792 /DNA_ORIENTATION=+